MAYVELHCHSAYSFLDGASHPEELAARAAELGYEALALTDHDGVYGSLEFAHAAKAFGVRPITGAEVTLRGGSHVTLLVESAARIREPLPAADRGARRHSAEGDRAAAAGARSGAPGGAERGSRLPLRLRAGRARCPGSERGRRAGPRVRARAVLRRAPAPVRAGRHAAEREAARARRDAGRRDRRHRRRACAQLSPRRAPGRDGRDPPPDLPRGRGARAARESRVRAARARAGWRSGFRRTPMPSSARASSPRGSSST